MNETQTRAELIDPALRESGWGDVPESKIQREYRIAPGKVQSGGRKSRPLYADYILTYKNRKLAVIEAKRDTVSAREGVAQAKDYAHKLHIPFTYATNGKEIYQINMRTGEEQVISAYPTPEALWAQTYAPQPDWQDKFDQIPFEELGGTKPARYYQEIAVNRALGAIATDKERILLTLATGTGKTFIAFQIVWKLFHTRWNLRRDGSRRPRILFLADRNILADQAFNAFNAFPEDALVRIRPNEIRKRGRIPTNGSIFFTIFQTFMSGLDEDGNPAPYFGEYPPDFFDFIIIDECHRGGANDESNWRAIMEHFSPAVQLGLTATPRRDDNIDTYRYFGDPVYVYSLKEGINDGFLTPYKVRRTQTTLDEYTYTSDDTVIEGEIEEGKVYTEADFNRIIEIKAREKKRVELFMQEIDQRQKTLVFCATQDHAAAIRDLINQTRHNATGGENNPLYCVRVTANDGNLGEEYLRQFQDNDKTIPTILTTSQKLSTGVDARNVRNIVLLRPINSMIEFKQIIGRGTRLFDGKEYFTIYDFVDAHNHFRDPEWDGEPEDPEDPKPPKELCPVCGKRPCQCEKELPEPCPKCGQSPCECQKKVIVKLADGKEREIQHMSSTLFYNADGTPISAEEFLHQLFGKLPDFFTTEEELRRIWSQPSTRHALLDNLAEAGFGHEELKAMQRIINAEHSDLFDVLEYIAFAQQPISRELRVAKAQHKILASLSPAQKQFLEFVLAKYIENGVDELAQEKLPPLLMLKYKAIEDAKEILGTVEAIREIFVGFQKHLYEPSIVN